MVDKHALGRQIADATDRDDYREVTRLCLEELADKSHVDFDDHWVLLHLALASLELDKMEEAKDDIALAKRLAPGCLLLQWYEACFYNDRAFKKDDKHDVKRAKQDWKRCLLVLQKIHRRATRKLKSSTDLDGCWESRPKTESILNDTRAMMGFCYLNLGDPAKALLWLKKHLRYRRAGLYTVYKRKVIDKYIRNLSPYVRKTPTQGVRLSKSSQR